VRDLVQERLGSRPAGPIRRLTHLRYWGYCFNPASFFYCFDPEGKRVEAIVVEVTNTPWKERHCYVLGDGAERGAMRAGSGSACPKVFHVSPFMQMEINYDWRFQEPDHTLGVHDD